MIQRNIFLLTCVLFCVWLISGCSDSFLVDPKPIVTNPNQGVEAIIGLNDNPLSTRLDSVLTNAYVTISSVFSTGNIMRREWRIYRVRTGQQIGTDTNKYLSEFWTTPDTLLFYLKVFGYNGPSDTSSKQLTLRILNTFGGGTSVLDLYLLNFNPNNTVYTVVVPYGRMPNVPPPFLNPRTTGTHNNWGFTPLTDSVVGRGWKFDFVANSYDITTFNYVINPTVWSLASGSIYKTPGPDNTYSIKTINGQIYPINGGPVYTAPGGFGDTVGRYEATVDSLIFYPNHAWIPTPIGTAWMEMNLHGFVRDYQQLYGNTGYGRFAVPISLIRQYANQIKWRFGGNQVADMSHSPWLFQGYIAFQFVSPRPGEEPLQVGDNLQLVGPNKKIVQITVRKNASY